MNIIVVRHGQTDWNINNILQGTTDIDLNENGINQARELSQILFDINIDVLYTSPLQRAVHTANYINESRNLNIIIDNRLIERDFGNYEEKNDNNIDMKEYWDIRSNISDSNIESMQSLLKRCYLFLIDICQKYENTNKNILLVTHSGVNLAISSIILGYRHNIFDYNLKNCHYRIFEKLTQKKLEDLYGKLKI